MRDPSEVVRKFCEAFSRRDPDELTTFFAEDAVYQNMPVGPVRGKDAIRGVLKAFLSPARTVEFAILNLSADGEVVLTERVDRFDMDGRMVELPVAGAFEVHDGQIIAWRDYFDMNTWAKQTKVP